MASWWCHLSSCVLSGSQDGRGAGLQDLLRRPPGDRDAGGGPKEVRDVLSEALKKVITSDEFRARMEKLTYAPLYMDPQTYSTFWGEYENQGRKWVDWAKVKQAGSQTA